MCEREKERMLDYLIVSCRCRLREREGGRECVYGCVRVCKRERETEGGVCVFVGEKKRYGSFWQHLVLAAWERGRERVCVYICVCVCVCACVRVKEKGCVCDRGRRQCQTLCYCLDECIMSKYE